MSRLNSRGRDRHSDRFRYCRHCDKETLHVYDFTTGRLFCTEHDG